MQSPDQSRLEVVNAPLAAAQIATVDCAICGDQATAGRLSSRRVGLRVICNQSISLWAAATSDAGETQQAEAKYRQRRRLRHRHWGLDLGLAAVKQLAAGGQRASRLFGHTERAGIWCRAAVVVAEAVGIADRRRGEGIDQAAWGIGRGVGALGIGRIVEPIQRNRRTVRSLPDARAGRDEAGDRGGEISVADGHGEVDGQRGCVDQAERTGVEDVQRARIGRGADRGLDGAVHLYATDSLIGELEGAGGGIGVARRVVGAEEGGGAD